MKKNILLLILGVIIGASLMPLVSFISNQKDQTKYVKLKKDCTLSNGSILKEGTLLRIDKGFSEGHTRYILYVNHKGDMFTELKIFDKENLEHPYWMQFSDK